MAGVPGLQEPLQPGMALVQELDQKLLVQLRDGRKIVGVLRSFDQFANLVLEGSYERTIIGKQYTDVDIGLQVIRGENVVLLGQIDPAKEFPEGYERVSKEAIEDAKRAQKEEERLKGTMRQRFDFLDLE